MHSRKNYLTRLNYSLNEQLRELRTVVRVKESSIIGVIENYISGCDHINHYDKHCLFCGTTKDITKEHVIPRWIIGKEVKLNMSKEVQEYNEKTIPACKTCNSIRLNGLEKYICKLLNQANFKSTSLRISDVEAIISWFEIIDYKFQLLYINAMLVPQTSLNEFNEAIEKLKESLKRITFRKKTKSHLSLVWRKVIDKDFFCKHIPNEFIYIKLPSVPYTIFYFYKKYFLKVDDATRASEQAIKKISLKLPKEAL